MDDLTAEEHGVVQAMQQPGNQIIFIDDGGTPGTQLPREVLVRDYVVFAGLLFDSTSYIDVEDEWARWMKKALRVSPDVVELHATDMVSPGKRSPWLGKPISDRLELMEWAFDIVSRASRSLYELHVGGEDFERILDEISRKDRGPAPRGSWYKDQKKCAAMVLHKALAEMLPTQTSGEVVLMQDLGANEKPRVEQFLDPSLPIHLQGVVYQPSHAFAGLQLADLCAFMLNRGYHTAHRVYNLRQDPGPFDVLVHTWRKKFQERIVEVLEVVDA